MSSIARGSSCIRAPGVGSEPLWAAYASPQFAIGTSYLRHVVFGDPAWDPAAFELDRDLGRAEQVDADAAKAMDPDLSAFVARGGKLILYHGTTDGLIPYLNTVNYYDSVVTALGTARAEEHVKLYLVPGMDHCAGGEGAFAVDWLSAMEGWVERGEAPGALPAAHPATCRGLSRSAGDAERAVHAAAVRVPAVAQYKGSGDVTDAASFECVTPAGANR